MSIKVDGDFSIVNFVYHLKTSKESISSSGSKPEQGQLNVGATEGVKTFSLADFWNDDESEDPKKLTCKIISLREKQVVSYQEKIDNLLKYASEHFTECQFKMLQDLLKEIDFNNIDKSIEEIETKMLADSIKATVKYQEAISNKTIAMMDENGNWKSIASNPELLIQAGLKIKNKDGEVLAYDQNGFIKNIDENGQKTYYTNQEIYNMFNSGDFGIYDSNNQLLDLENNFNIREVLDESDDAKAQADYEVAMIKMEAKNKTLECIKKFLGLKNNNNSEAITNTQINTFKQMFYDAYSKESFCINFIDQIDFNNFDESIKNIQDQIQLEYEQAMIKLNEATDDNKQQAQADYESTLARLHQQESVLHFISLNWGAFNEIV